MDKADEEWVRELEEGLPQQPPPANEAWFWAAIRNLLKFVRVMDAMGSDLREDSTAYQTGWTEARRELLEVLGRRNHQFQLDPSIPIHVIRDLINVYLRQNNLLSELPRFADDRLRAMYRQQQMFGDATLPEICMMLRMGVNGSAEEWRPSDIRATLDMLQERVRTWHNDSAWTQRGRVDDCVEQLVRATVAEVMDYGWWQQPEAGG